MSRKTLYLICCIVLIIFAFGFIVIPQQFMSVYGATLGIQAVLIARFLGAVQLGNAYFLWQMKDTTKSSRGGKIFSQAQVLEWGLVAIFVVIATVTGIYNAMAWGQVVLCIAFAILFALDGFR